MRRKEQIQNLNDLWQVKMNWSTFFKSQMKRTNLKTFELSILICKTLIECSNLCFILSELHNGFLKETKKCLFSLFKHWLSQIQHLYNDLRLQIWFIKLQLILLMMISNKHFNFLHRCLESHPKKLKQMLFSLCFRAVINGV